MSDSCAEEPSDDRSPAELETVQCPECGAPAELVSEGWSESTHGPVEHVRIWCIRRHFYFMPRPPATPSRPRSETGWKRGQDGVMEVLEQDDRSGLSPD
jgi:hypothetical protein